MNFVLSHGNAQKQYSMFVQGKNASLRFEIARNCLRQITFTKEELVGILEILSTTGEGWINEDLLIRMEGYYTRICKNITVFMVPDQECSRLRNLLPTILNRMTLSGQTVLIMTQMET